MLIPSETEAQQKEVWVKITNDVIPNIAPIFYISNYGRLYNSETGNYLPKNINYDKDKYITVRLKDIYGNKIFAQPHRLVLLCFQPVLPINVEELEPNHLDNVKFHNWLWNLQWTTHQENIAYAKQMGLFKTGEQHVNSKFTEKEIREFCNLLHQGYTPKQISKMVNRTDCNVEKLCFNILNGHCWKHISCEYSF